MERLRHYVVPEEPQLAPQPQVRISEEIRAPEAEAPTPPTVQVIWGPLVESLAAVGMTVANVRDLLRGPLNIPAHAGSAVNGRPVSPRHRLAAGDVLEFVRHAGEKGTGR